MIAITITHQAVSYAALGEVDEARKHSHVGLKGTNPTNLYMKPALCIRASSPGTGLVAGRTGIRRDSQPRGGPPRPLPHPNNLAMLEYSEGHKELAFSILKGCFEHSERVQRIEEAQGPEPPITMT